MKRSSAGHARVKCTSRPCNFFLTSVNFLLLSANFVVISGKEDSLQPPHTAFCIFLLRLSALIFPSKVAPEADNRPGGRLSSGISSGLRCTHCSCAWSSSMPKASTIVFLTHSAGLLSVSFSFSPPNLKFRHLSQLAVSYTAALSSSRFLGFLSADNFFILEL